MASDRVCELFRSTAIVILFVQVLTHVLTNLLSGMYITLGRLTSTQSVFNVYKVINLREVGLSIHILSITITVTNCEANRDITDSFNTLSIQSLLRQTLRTLSSDNSQGYLWSLTAH